MYSPNFDITSLILSYIVRYELAVQKISLTHLPKSHQTNLYEKIHAEDINQIAQLIGHPTGYNTALNIQRGKVLPSFRPKLKIFMNYRSSHDFVDTYSSSNFILPSTELAVHMNKLLMKGILDEWELGKLRDFTEKPNEVYDTWYKVRDIYPNLSFKKHFDSVFAWIIKPKTRVHKLIQLSCLVYEFLDKAPFSTGNQLTTILTTSAIAKEYGYNPNNLIPFGRAINFINPDIIAAHKLTKKKRDLTVFIEALLYTFSLTAMSVEGQVVDTFSNKVKKHTKLQEMFNPRQIKALDFLEVEGKITRNQYSKVMGVSFMTAFRDLQELFKGGYLTQKGVGRGTFYTLKPQKEEIVEELPVFGN